MITGIEGIPGSGKSYEAVVFHVLPALAAGRKIITNLPLNVEAFKAIDQSYPDLIEVRTRPADILGTWDASNIAEREAFQPTYDEPVRSPASVSTFGTVWDYWSEWRGEKGQGPLFVIDECHVSLPRLGTPDSVIEWFKLHRHYNADVVLLTQSFRDICQPISQLLASLIRCRKADILGRSNRYIRKVHAGYRGALIQTNERPYRSQFFGLYKSNTQSQSSAESEAQDVSPFVVKFKRFQWSFIAVALVYAVWAFWPRADQTWLGTKIQPAQHITVKPPLVASTPSAIQPAPLAPVEPQKPSKGLPGVLEGKNLHIIGDMNMGGRIQTTFAVSDGGRRIFTTTSDELVKAGYRFNQVGPCFGWLHHLERKIAIVCDAPAIAQGTTGAPVVYDSGLRRSSETPAY